MPDEPTLQQTLVSYACAVVGGAIVGALAGVWLYMGLATNAGRGVTREQRERREELADWARHDRSAPTGIVLGGAAAGAVLAAGALHRADPVRRRA